MSEHSIYSDIARRTGGDIYIGAVGPVRSGKSTFIKRFMEALVLPNIKDDYARRRARDELPQSAGGRTVMTTEPKFIPESAATVEMSGGESMRVKMIDCVGYMVPGVLGTEEDGRERTVRTPWRSEPMPFVEAAELGTRTVINEHATIGMLISTDGSIGELPRESYVGAEERLVKELKRIGKPFAMILNSANPSAQESISLAYELEERYGVPVALVNCLELDAEDIKSILEMVLCEFPVSEIRVSLPEWMQALDTSHPVKASIYESICRCAQSIGKVGEIREALSPVADNEYVSRCELEETDYGTGCARVCVRCERELYYRVVGELTGFEIDGEGQIVGILREYSAKKGEMERVLEALADAEESGYGIIMPDASRLRLEEPEIVRQGSGYGVRLRASGQSIHMIRANIEAEINPMMESEFRSEELVKHMLEEFEGEPQRIWELNMLGKSLYELMNDGLRTKLGHMSPEARAKLSETLERIINEGSGGLICIIL